MHVRQIRQLCVSKNNREGMRPLQGRDGEQMLPQLFLPVIFAAGFPSLSLMNLLSFSSFEWSWHTMQNSLLSQCPGTSFWGMPMWGNPEFTRNRVHPTNLFYVPGPNSLYHRLFRPYVPYKSLTCDVRDKSKYISFPDYFGLLWKLKNCFDRLAKGTNHFVSIFRVE